MTWYSHAGHKIANPLRDPQPIHGAATKSGQLLYVTIDGERLHIVRKGLNWTLADELGHGGISGSAYTAELSDGSYWWIVRDLSHSGTWLGERIDGLEPLELTPIPERQ